MVYSLAGKRVGSQAVTHIRLWIALPAIVLVHLLFLGTFFPSGIPLSAFLFLAGSGFLGFCITDMCIFKALVDLGPRETSVVMSLTPIFSTVLSWIVIKEHLSFMQICGILTTVGGVVWVVAEEGARRKGHSKLLPGLAAAFAGAFLQAITVILAKRGMVEDVSPISANLIRVVFGLIGISIIALLHKSFFKDFRSMSDRVALLMIGSGAMVGPVLGMILALTALSAVPVGVAMTLMHLTPIILLPVDHFMFKKKLGIGAVAGTVLAVAGAAILFASTGGAQ